MYVNLSLSEHYQGSTFIPDVYKLPATRCSFLIRLNGIFASGVFEQNGTRLVFTS